MYWREIEPATKPTRRQTVTNARLANSCRDAERTMGQSWPEYPLAVQGSPQARSAQKTAPPPIAVEATAQRRVNFMLDRLTNVRDFPVPRRHESAKIGLRHQS